MGDGLQFYKKTQKTNLFQYAPRGLPSPDSSPEKGETRPRRSAPPPEGVRFNSACRMSTHTLTGTIEQPLSSTHGRVRVPGMSTGLRVKVSNQPDGGEG